ncbi:MAG: DUF4097 domain-containing protein [Gemmatimonadota bacterium]|nr:DUF4097 domain-containing protein [Gemmatimonadota bacterium]
MRRTLLIYMFAAAALLAASPPVAHAQRERDRDEYASRIDTTIAFSRNGTVELQAYSGEIIVSAWARDQVRVRATSERSALRFEASPARLSLGLRSGRSGDTRFEVTVPVGVRVRANTSSGDIRITGSKAEVEARTQGGDIVVEDVGPTDITAFSGDVGASGINGELRINALSGDVRIRQVVGNVEAKTVSGEIDLRDARSKYVRAGSTSGDITFDGTIDPDGRYELQTHSGDVELTLPSNVGAQLTLSTYSGTIDSDFPLTLEPNRPYGAASSHGKSFTFTLGRGGARITAESFSGDITIRSRGGPGGRNEGDR